MSMSMALGRRPMPAPSCASSPPSRSPISSMSCRPVSELMARLRQVNLFRCTHAVVAYGP
jgi:hypothetical protein